MIAIFFIGWDSLLAKYFKKLPSGFTHSYFFSLKMIWSLIDTFVTIQMKKQFTFNVQSLKPSRHKECHCFGAFFGSVERKEWSMKTLSLAKHSGVALINTKLASLAKKYFSIPPEKIFHYPDIPYNIKGND